MNGLPYYKAYPRDFIEGTIGMPFEIKCAYRVVLDLIYMQGGKLPDDARYISGNLGCSVRKWKSIREALLEAGKLHVLGDFLVNFRADKELETLRTLRDKQAENASGPRKVKDLAKPRLNHTEPEPEPEKKREPKGSLKEVGPTFDDFWEVVPRKRAKGDARKAWARAVKRADPQAIIDGMARYAREREGQDEKYTAYPASWLNADRWQDEPDTSSDAKHSNFYAEIERMMGNGGPSDSDEIRGSDAEHHFRDYPVHQEIQATGTHGRCDGGEDNPGHSREPEQSYLSLVKPRRFGGPRF